MFQNMNFAKCGIVDRIKTPLKILYKSKYSELLDERKPAIEYDEDGNIQKINIEPEKQNQQSAYLH